MGERSEVLECCESRYLGGPIEMVNLSDGQSSDL